MESLTFNACVDEVVAESGRPDKRSLIADYVNTSIRECQGLAFFSSDLEEESVTPTADPHIWDKPNLFYKLKTVKYANGEYPDFIQPGKGLIDKDYYYYGTGNSIAYFGCGSSSTDTISLAYYQYLQRLRYRNPGQRPAIWNIDLLAWEYYDLTGIGLLNYTLSANQETARNLVTNWLLFRHFDLIKEGALAKIFKNINDLQRSSMAFSLFSSLKVNLLNMEAHESLDRG